MNLYRKYGTDWNVLARTRALDRLDSWGFNTIGNWSSSDLFAVRRVPYTVAVGYDTSSLTEFSSANQQMVDVFDPGFFAKVAAGISRCNLQSQERSLVSWLFCRKRIAVGWVEHQRS